MIRAARPCGGPILAVGSRVLRADCCALDRVVQYPVRARDALKLYSLHDTARSIHFCQLSAVSIRSLIMYTSHIGANTPVGKIQATQAHHTSFLFAKQRYRD